jgi:hypothetical protein
MHETISLPSPLSLGSPPTEHLILHLLRHPADLIDVRHLMRQFQASPAEVQHALRWLEQHYPVQDKEAP